MEQSCCQSVICMNQLREFYDVIGSNPWVTGKEGCVSFPQTGTGLRGLEPRLQRVPAGHRRRLQEDQPREALHTHVCVQVRENTAHTASPVFSSQPGCYYTFVLQ